MKLLQEKRSLKQLPEKNIDGTGIDLDNDKILDAFWFNEVQDSQIIEVITRLYVNLEGKWIPIWYTYFREM